MTKRAIKLLIIILSLVGLIVLFFATSVRTKAMNSEIDLNRTIMIVKRELETAENILIKKDKVLFEIYKNNPFSESGHMAELELRRRYPEEYNRYIEAKGYLDDLYYTKFMVVIDSLKQGEEQMIENKLKELKKEFENATEEEKYGLIEWRKNDKPA